MGYLILKEIGILVTVPCENFELQWTCTYFIKEISSVRAIKLMGVVGHVLTHLINMCKPKCFYF